MVSVVVFRELGKWLFDVAKYVATVVILTNVFTDLHGKYILLTGVLCVGIALLCGIVLINISEKRNE